MMSPKAPGELIEERVATYDALLPHRLSSRGPDAEPQTKAMVRGGAVVRAESV